MFRKKSLFFMKVIIVICLFVIFLILSSYFVRIVIYKNSLDPLEDSIIQALDNKNLVLGSPLNLWVNDLGNPDLIAITGNKFKSTEFYWLHIGIAVSVRGEFDTLGSALNQKVVGIIMPIRKNVPLSFISNRKIILSNNGDKSKIEFNRLLDAELGETNFHDLTKREISKVYENYDASENVYYNMPFLYKRASTRLYYDPNTKCSGSSSCEEKIQILLVSDTDIFKLSNFLAGLKRAILY